MQFEGTKTTLKHINGMKYENQISIIIVLSICLYCTYWRTDSGINLSNLIDPTLPILKYILPSLTGLSPKEAVGLSRVHMYYPKSNLPSQDFAYSVLEHINTTSMHTIRR